MPFFKYSTILSSSQLFSMLSINLSLKIIIDNLNKIIRLKSFEFNNSNLLIVFSD